MKLYLNFEDVASIICTVDFANSAILIVGTLMSGDISRVRAASFSSNPLMSRLCALLPIQIYSFMPDSNLFCNIAMVCSLQVFIPLDSHMN